MKVAHEDDHVTHAIIGGGQARDFGISDDPAFFQILSSTLYSNQKLAVVRETLCNGWDAHIDAGKTDVPLEVTLTDNTFIIRDFGSGIADEDMQPIYGVYGASTKKHDKKATGGFGLGCKAPFAYSDHFKVTSCHNGKKTIYSLSRSSAEVGGKPGIFPIASFPTEETGLEVEIPVTHYNDRSTFARLVQEVAMNGEILVKLNGSLLNVLPFSKAELGFLMVNHRMDSQVSVRLGNVVYPVPYHEDLQQALKMASDFCARFAGSNSLYSIIFQAEADSLTVTPSRETLSTTSQTIETLNKLIPAAIKKAEQGLKELSASEYRKYFQQFQTPEAAKPLFKMSAKLNPTEMSKSIMVKKNDLARRSAAICITSAYRGKTGYQELLTRARILQRQGVLPKDVTKSFRATLIYGSKHYNVTETTRFWFYDSILNPIVDALKTADLPLKRLFVSVKGRRYDHDSFDPIERVHDKYLSFDPRDYFAFARKVVAIGFSKEDIGKRVRAYTDVLTADEPADGLFAYVVPRTFTKTNKVRETFQALGYTVLDFTVRHPWEADDVLLPVVREVRNPNKGIPLLSGIRVGKQSFNMPKDPATSKDVKARTEKPEFVLTIKRGAEGVELTDYLNAEATKAIMDMFDKKLGLTTSKAQEAAYLKKGAKSLNTHLIELIVKEYETNPRIRAHLARDFTRIKLPGVFVLFMNAVEKIPELQPTLGLVQDLTQRDWNIISIARSLTKARCFDSTAIEDAAEKVKLDSAFVSTINRMSCNKLMDVFDIYPLVRILHSPEPYSSTTRPALIEMIKLAVASNSKETQK